MDIEVDVAIAGGGLGGLAAAEALAQTGARVALFEREPTFGGKAGSRFIDGAYEDHGYHVFAPWYKNTLRLIAAAGATDNFVPAMSYYQLRRNEYPNYRRLSWNTIVDSVFTFLNGPASPLAMLLMYFAGLDAFVRYFGDTTLQRESIQGHLRKRYYHFPDVERELAEFLQSAHAVPGEEADAWIMPRIAALTLGGPRSPLVWVPQLSLEEALINPIVDRLDAQGCSLYPLVEVEELLVEGGRVKGLRCRNLGTPGSVTVAAQAVILSLPPEAFGALGGIDSSLERLAGLPTRQLASLHFIPSQPLPNVPDAHIRLVGSRLCITLVELNMLRGIATSKQEFNVVIGDFSPLAGLNDDEAIDAVFEELSAYGLVARRNDCIRVVLQRHETAQLFAPVKDTWRSRPSTLTGVRGLYLAGDYTQTDIVLPTMEAAVVSGLSAAACAQRHISLPEPPIDVLPLEIPNRVLSTLQWVALIPIIAVVTILRRFRARIRSRGQCDAVAVRPTDELQQPLDGGEPRDSTVGFGA